MPPITITFRTTVTALASSLSLLAPTLATGADLPVSCAPKAAAEVNEGLTLLHNMMYIQAEEVFNTASDADCAMARWGIAIAITRSVNPRTGCATTLRYLPIFRTAAVNL